MGGAGLRVATTFVLVMAMAGAAGADEHAQPPLVLSSRVIQQGIEDARQGVPLAPRQFASPQQRAGSRSTGRRVVWTAVGAAGGFFAGGYLGSAIENGVAPCGCDDPGLKGALIGFPIGAIAGGVPGWMLSK
jgi:hypothetical protein